MAAVGDALSLQLKTICLIITGNMKKQYILLAGLVIFLIGLTFLSLDKYQSSPENMTLGKAIEQRDTALTSLEIQKRLNTVNEQAASATIKQLDESNEKLEGTNAVLCEQIKTARLSQPLCQ